MKKRGIRMMSDEGKKEVIARAIYRLLYQKGLLSRDEFEELSKSD